MTPILLSAWLALPGATTVLDSTGLRRPQFHLTEVAAGWAPAPLSDRLVLDVGDGRNATAAREALAAAMKTFTGDWKIDFERFRSRWPRTLADGSWPVAVAALWRSRPDQELQSRAGLRGAEGPVLLQDWVRWIETVDPRVRLTLAELTSRELSTPGSLGPTDLPVGGILSLDLSRCRWEGPVRIRFERLVRRGTRFSELRPLGPDQTWKPPALRPVWTSKPWNEPGLYRVRWEARGFFQQALVRVGSLSVFAAPTDSGMLVWADGQKTSTSRLIWSRRSGAPDSLDIDLSRPVHLGFPAAADSGLVGIVSGGEFTTLRLRRARPAHQEMLGLSEERDRWGRPLLVPPRVRGRSGWLATALLERDAFEKGETARIEGWMRHFDTYGRPDALRGDSVEWSLEPVAGPSIRRWAKPDARGRWKDSVRIERKGLVRVTALAAEGGLLREAPCDSGTFVRIREPDNSCLDARPPDTLASSSGDTLRVDLRRPHPAPSLLLVVQGRTLDWLPLGASDTTIQARVPWKPSLEGGAQSLLVSPTPEGWTGWRQSVDDAKSCRESRFPLGIVAELPATARKGTPLPPLRVFARSGPATALSVSLRLVPDKLAAPLVPLCAALGQGRSVSEVYTGDAAWIPLGLGEPDFQGFDRRRDPDLFARIGLRAFPAPCIACRPWIGSWDTKTGEAALPASCGWTNPALPCAKSEPVAAASVLTREVATESDGSLRLDWSWPAKAGLWRLQAWGMDSLGRTHAWERRVQVR